MITTLSFDLDDTLWDPRPALVAADKAQWLALTQHYPDLAEHFTRDKIFVCRKQILTDAPSIVGDVTALRIEVMYRLLLSLDIAPAEADESARMAFEAFMAKRNDVILFPETIPMLEKVSESYTVVAITNGNADVFKTEIGPYFRPFDSRRRSRNSKTGQRHFRPDLGKTWLPIKQRYPYRR